MMIRVKHKGDFSNLEKLLKKSPESALLKKLEKYGRAGVDALAAATPVESGETANSWYYKVENTSKGATLSFHNSNIQNGVPIAVVLQYGHGTGTGGWVEGRDYINPAIQPIFDKIAQEALWEVTNL